MAIRPTTLTFNASYGPADAQRALDRFPEATLEQLNAFISAAAQRLDDAKHAIAAATSKGKNAFARSVAAWTNICNEVQDRIDAIHSANSKARNEAIYNKNTEQTDAEAVADIDAATDETEAPTADEIDAAQDAAPAKVRGCREGSMMGLALAYLRRCRGNAHTPKEIFAAITEAGWTSPAGKTPEATMRAALQNAVKKGILTKADKGQYTIAAA